MKKLLIGAAALGLVAPAVAQVTAPAPAPQVQRPLAAKAHTRADVQAHVAQMFARLDADRDGFLTKAEADAGKTTMRAHMVERVKQRTGERGGAFERLDANNDGSISRAEWDSARGQRAERGAGGGQRMGGMHRMAMIGGRMFEMADANRDGRVSLAEAQAGALRHFDTLDTNRDGQITREERMQMRKRIRTERSAG